ncbi:MAG: response regulator [Phycisphaerales bacterium]|nr:response regulator [Phycisphaerales bacterium]
MSRRILLADDEPHITAVVARRLEGAGFETRVVQDGEEALRVVPEYAPDLVITDLQMPCMSGLEMATKLFEAPETSSIPVIMLTGRGYVLDEAELATTNIRELMSKPFSARRILECVEKILGPDRQAA